MVEDVKTAVGSEESTHVTTTVKSDSKPAKKKPGPKPKLRKESSVSRPLEPNETVAEDTVESTIREKSRTERNELIPGSVLHLTKKVKSFRFADTDSYVGSYHGDVKVEEVSEKFIKGSVRLRENMCVVRFFSKEELSINNLI